MALKPKSRPVFEELQEEVEAEEAAAAEEAAPVAPAAVKPAPAAAPAAKPPTTAPAIVKPATTAIAQPKIDLAACDVIAALKDRLPPPEYGEGVTLNVSNSLFLDGDKGKVGSSILFQLLSWNERFVISPGSNDPASREYTRYSYDGDVTTRGEPVDRYLADLRSLGYDKAAKKTYVDFFGFLLESNMNTPHIGSSLAISLSPDSVKSLNGFRRDLVVRLAMGRLPMPDVSQGLVLQLDTEVKSVGSNTWTRVTFSMPQEA